jgi:hypothetical protein
LWSRRPILAISLGLVLALLGAGTSAASQLTRATALAHRTSEAALDEKFPLMLHDDLEYGEWDDKKVWPCSQFLPKKRKPRKTVFKIHCSFPGPADLHHGRSSDRLQASRVLWRHRLLLDFDEVGVRLDGQQSFRMGRAP